jgi:translation initiation factor 4G
MGDTIIRSAREDDAPFLAWVMQEADRGHVGIGSWDVLLPGEDAPRLEIIEELIREGEGSYVDWRLFLVAEIGGERGGAVAYYVPKQHPNERFVDALIRVLGRRGWSQERVSEALGPAFSKSYFSVPIPADTFRVEWVATEPEFRGRGLNRLLLEKLLERARADGHRTAHVATYWGNEPAIRAYESAGFRRYAEVRHADYERVFKAPGLVYLRCNL